MQRKDEILMNEKISVIIPVYKVQEYLPKCIESVLQQTYHNLEIILVDDGSPDKCGKICEAYAKKDSRIQVIHKKNGGLASARNAGMDCASGDFILFVDSDDWITKNACQVLYQGLKRYDADCAVGKCITVLDKKGRFIPQKSKAQPLQCKTPTEAMKQVLLTCSSSCNRLYKRNIIERFRFPEGRINEDEPVMLRVYAKCNKILFLDQETYYYRKRSNSITTSHFSLQNVDCYYNSAENLTFIKKKKPELTECAEFKYIKTMLYCYVHLSLMKRNPKTEKIRKELHKNIRKNRSLALKNRYLPIKLKLLMLICAV